MTKKNRIHFKKLLAFFVIVVISMFSRGISWLDGNWYGAILTLITITFIISECFDNAQDIRISAGITGVSVEEHNKDGEQQKS